MTPQEINDLLDAIDELGTPLSHREVLILDNINKFISRGEVVPKHYQQTLPTIYRSVSQRAMQ